MLLKARLFLRRLSRLLQPFIHMAAARELWDTTLRNQNGTYRYQNFEFYLAGQVVNDARTHFSGIAGLMKFTRLIGDRASPDKCVMDLTQHKQNIDLLITAGVANHATQVIDDDGCYTLVCKIICDLLDGAVQRDNSLAAKLNDHVTGNANNTRFNFFDKLASYARPGCCKSTCRW